MNCCLKKFHTCLGHRTKEKMCVFLSIKIKSSVRVFRIDMTFDWSILKSSGYGKKSISLDLWIASYKARVLSITVRGYYSKCTVEGKMADKWNLVLFNLGWQHNGNRLERGRTSLSKYIFVVVVPTQIGKRCQPFIPSTVLVLGFSTLYRVFSSSFFSVYFTLNNVYILIKVIQKALEGIV